MAVIGRVLVVEVVEREVKVVKVVVLVDSVKLNVSLVVIVTRLVRI